MRTGVAQVPRTARGWIHKTGNDGVIMVVEDTEQGVLVGATAMAPTGGEILGGLTLAVHARVPVERLRQMICAYPTFHRGIEDCGTLVLTLAFGGDADAEGPLAAPRPPRPRPQLLQFGRQSVELLMRRGHPLLDKAHPLVDGRWRVGDHARGKHGRLWVGGAGRAG